MDCGLLVWRRELKIYFWLLPLEEAWALDAVIAGSEFAEICGGLCQWFDETLVAAHVAAMLKTWIGEEMISRISYPDQSLARDPDYRYCS